MRKLSVGGIKRNELNLFLKYKTKDFKKQKELLKNIKSNNIIIEKILLEASLR